MMKITGLSHLFKWENLHNWWLTKYFFAPQYLGIIIHYMIIFSFMPIIIRISSKDHVPCKHFVNFIL